MLLFVLPSGPLYSIMGLEYVGGPGVGIAGTRSPGKEQLMLRIKAEVTTGGRFALWAPLLMKSLIR